MMVTATVRGMMLSRVGPITTLFWLATSVCMIACAGQKYISADGGDSNGHRVVLEGVFVERSFVNKAGREYPSVRELYFRTGGEEYFVRLDRSRIRADRMRSLAGRPVRVRAVIVFGLWDTDDPNVQSRVGEYLVVEEIVERVRDSRAKAKSGTWNIDLLI